MGKFLVIFGSLCLRPWGSYCMKFGTMRTQFSFNSKTLQKLYLLMDHILYCLIFL